MLDKRVSVVATTFLDHLAKKQNPVPVADIHAKLFGGDHAQWVEWLDDLVARGKLKVLLDGATVPEWPTSDARRVFTAALADETVWQRYALDVKTA